MDFQEKLVAMYNEGVGKFLPFKLVLKEPKVLQPFCPKVKIDKKFNEDGRLVRYTLSRKPKKEYILYIYKSTTHEIGVSNKASRVKYIYSLRALGLTNNDIESLEFCSKNPKNIDWDIKNKEYILNNLHENLWDTFKVELNNDDFRDVGYIRENRGRRIKTQSMASVFPHWVLKELEYSINNKKNFSYKMNGTKRARSVEVRMCEDGIFRGWYSSEYSGCLNGDYYLLINPRTAIFCEHD